MKVSKHYGLLAHLSRFVSLLVDHWFVVLVVAFFLSPVGPHIRWEYQYREGYARKPIYISCTYVGSRGFVTPQFSDDCPLFVWLDAEESQ